MSSEDAVLRQYLAAYVHQDYVRKEVLKVVATYKSLAYHVEAFVFNNGSRKDLLNLAGTIPVAYKGSFYNIPVCIWLMDTHPNNAPLCFVKPTADMSIKVSKYVDYNGRIFMPYLNQWNPSSSSVLGLIACMITAFGELPPVYSRPRNDARQPPYPVNPYMPQPQPAYPAPEPSAYPGAGQPYPAPAPGPPYPAYPGYPPAPAPYPAAGSTITEEHIKASLLSAVEDKLRRRLCEQAQQGAAELETLRRTQGELRAGAARLDAVLARLQRERAELDRCVGALRDKERELQAGVERLAQQDGVAVDEAVVTTAPLYTQLLGACAEEAALEDAVYYVGEALRKELIDLDTFLKQVRTLSRRQFTLRALMHKCRQKARLAC